MRSLLELHEVLDVIANAAAIAYYLAKLGRMLWELWSNAEPTVIRAPSIVEASAVAHGRSSAFGIPTVIRS